MSMEIGALQAEIERLQQMVRDASKEKVKALRLMRRSNTDLDERVRDQYQQLTTLHHLITSINESLNLKEVVCSAVADLELIVGVQATSLAAIDDDGFRFLVTRPSSWWDTLSRVRLTLGKGIIGHVVQSGQTYVTNDAAHDPVFAHGIDTPDNFNVQSILCEPIIIHERVIGGLLLVNKWMEPFNETDRFFVETVAGSVAVAMENAHMYQQVELQLETLEKKNRQLVETQAQLIQSAKLASIGELTAGLTHEINNPIGIILGFAQLLEQLETDEQLKGYAGSIARESIRVKRIVDNLLGFARNSTLDLKRLDLREVIVKVLNLTEYQLLSENIRLHHIPSEVPVWVRADANQILQVLINLIQNARQAMPEGGVLTTQIMRNSEYGVFSITDTGVGISESDIGRIFDPFFTTKPVGQGTGLGLSVSHGIVARHGGDIQVNSQPGLGSTFIVRLPLAEL